MPAKGGCVLGSLPAQGGCLLRSIVTGTARDAGAGEAAGTGDTHVERHLVQGLAWYQWPGAAEAPSTPW
eukprot:482998-Pyramimonas_sp.AAC.1